MDRRKLTAAAMVAVILLATIEHSTAADDAKPLHLFILSGQSNMVGLDPNRTFAPAVKEAFGAGNVIVVKDALGGQPIRRWYKGWKVTEGQSPQQIGDLYDRLMKGVKSAVGDRKPTTVTFVWMQGEADAKQELGDEYADAMSGLIKQLREDLGRPDMNFVIGRLSDAGNTGDRFPDWMKVRQVQVKVAEADARGGWVDTDDLNGRTNDVHYTKAGYDELGRRFAAKAIALIKADGKPE